LELWRVAVRALIAYIYALVLVRLTGKRVVSQLTPIHFVVAVVVGDLFDDVMWAEVTSAEFFAAAGTLFLADITAELASARSARIYRLVNGETVVVMTHGGVDRRALRGEQLSENDLAHLLRLSGISRDRLDEIKLSALEVDHHLSVLREPWAEPARRRDLESSLEKS
jgi:uncharacterized membrane protein YcaP (DUF421 family)